MPEGHTVHRTARKFQKDFVGQQLFVTSPQGRFVDATLVSGQKLMTSEAFGKHLFLGFESGFIRVHLGIYGKWRFSQFEDTPKEPVGQVRARFLSSDSVADLVGPTACEVIDAASFEMHKSRLGPDPLRIDPADQELERFIARCKKSKTPIGQLLMDQSVISGIGNVYRAELLFRAGRSPYRPGMEVSDKDLAAIWFDAVKLMKIGVSKGIMLTRDDYLKSMPAVKDRYFVYKREGLPCRNCGNEVSLALMNARKLYWCNGCQSA
ncbi:MAG: Fpg/Nei family DNA glycosylase [Aquiluna sp.]|nr:Fpg/Nei family DNA glycosylase [Aquiluna sp.]